MLSIISLLVVVAAGVVDGEEDGGGSWGMELRLRRPTIITLPPSSYSIKLVINFVTYCRRQKTGLALFVLQKGRGGQ